MVEAPRDIVNIVVSYLTFLPRKCIFATEEKVNDMELCDNGDIICFTKNSVDVYKKKYDNYTKTVEIKIKIADILQYSNHEWFVIDSEILMYINTNKDLKYKQWKINKYSYKIYKVFEYILTGGYDINLDVHKLDGDHLDTITTISHHTFSSVDIKELDKVQRTWCLVENDGISFYKELSPMHFIKMSMLLLKTSQLYNNMIILEYARKPSHSLRVEYCTIKNCKIKELSKRPEKLLIDNFWKTKQYWIPNSQNMNFCIPCIGYNKFVDMFTNENYPLTNEKVVNMKFHNDMLIIICETKSLLFVAINT